MSQYTQNYNLYRPSRNNKEPLDNSLDNNFLKIDEELKKREDSFNEVKSQLAEKANQSDLNNANASISLKANKTDVRENTTVRPINVSEMDTETKQLFTGGAVAVVGQNVIGNENVKPQAVGAENTTFITIGKNKFDGNYKRWAIGGVQGNLSSLVLQSISTEGASNRVAMIRIDPNKTYTLKKFTGGNRFRIGVFNKYPVPTPTGITFDKPLYHPSDEGTNQVQTFTFTNDANGMYLCVYVSNESNNTAVALQVEEGTVATSYEEFNAEVSENIKTKDVEYRKKVDNILTETENLFDGNYLERVALGIGTTPWTLSDTTAEGTIGITAIIDVEPNTVYHVKKFDTSNRFRIALSNDKAVGSAVATQVNSDNSLDYFKVTTGTERYLIITVSNQGQRPRLSITKNTEAVKYEPKIYLNSKNVVDITKENLSPILLNELTFKDSEKPIIYGNFGTLFRTKELEGVQTGSTFDLGASLANSIYSEYDSLMSLYPSVITKKLLGYASNSSGTEDTGLPIYEYTFNPPTTTSSLQSRPVKLLLMTGLHGEEKSTVWSTLQFLKQMLADWYTNEQLASIKANVSIRLIPVANPFGYNQHARLNARGVDINRNFSYNWENQDTATPKGSAPYSELETRLLRDWMLSNKDADFFMDFHNFSLNKPQLTYINSPSKKVQFVYTSLIRRLSDVWEKRYAFGYPNTIYGFSANDPWAVTYNEAHYVAGIENSCIFEINMFNNGYGSTKYTKEVIETGTDLVANMILAQLNAYNL